MNLIVRELIDEIPEDCIKIQIIEPLGFLDFRNSLKKSDLIILDNGKMQEEVPDLEKHVLIIRYTR